MDYQPAPIDISDIRLPDDLAMLEEYLAQNTHEVWAQSKASEGWRYGKVRNDKTKETPWLVPYDELPESEKAYDRIISTNVLKVIIKLGYTVCKASEDEQDA